MLVALQAAFENGCKFLLSIVVKSHHDVQNMVSSQADPIWKETIAIVVEIAPGKLCDCRMAQRGQTANDHEQRSRARFVVGTSPRFTY